MNRSEAKVTPARRIKEEARTTPLVKDLSQERWWLCFHGAVSESNQWPCHFPAGCPPSEAQDASALTLYRAGKNRNEPHWRDGQSHYGRAPHKPEFDTCCHRGLSTYLTVDSVRTAMRNHPRRFKSVLRIEAPSTCAVVTPTPRGGNNHHTLWLRAAHEESFTSWCTVVGGIGGP